MNLSEKLRKFADIIDAGVSRPLSQVEYKFIKELPVFDEVKEFWVEHLGVEGFGEYRNSVSQGRHGKWLIYLELYKKHNSKLGKSLR